MLSTEAEKLVKIMRACNIGNAGSIVTAGLVRLFTLGDCGEKPGCPKTSMLIIGFYTFCFGVLLFPFLSRARWNGKADISLNTLCTLGSQDARHLMSWAD